MNKVVVCGVAATGVQPRSEKKRTQATVYECEREEEPWKEPHTP